MGQLQMMDNEEKINYLTMYMNSLIDQVKKDNAPNWIEVYAKEFVDVWGETESQKQITDMEIVNATERRFKAVVVSVLSERK